MNLTTLLMILLGAAVGALTGALAYAGWLRRKAGTRPRLPAKWPLAARGLVNSHEHEVLKWLRKTFHGHDVMVKIPVLRFTVPVDKAESQADSDRWQALLTGVYTTFTVCTADGKVVGCVDVPGKRGLSQANRELKETLLSDCGIAYTVVRATRLPGGSAMRAAFLGEIPVEAIPDGWETRGGGSTFHADMDAFTKQKMKDAREAALKEINKDSREEA
ncbi:MAG: DUF2726 domain-containing protein [Polaromonas sp.]